MCGATQGLSNEGFGSNNPYQPAAQSILSTAQNYGQMAALAAQNAPQQPAMAAPPAPQSAFNGGIGQYLAGMGAQPMGPSPAMSAVESFERQYTPQMAAADMLMSYQPGYEAQPLSYYTPNAMADSGFQSTAVTEEPVAPTSAVTFSRSRSPLSSEPSASRTSSNSSSSGSSLAPQTSMRPRPRPSSNSSSSRNRTSSSSGYTGLRDMFDGGGPGTSGNRFGGALGGVSNRIGLRPFGP